MLWGRRDGGDVGSLKMNHNVNIHPLARHAYCERENFLERVLDFQKKIFACTRLSLEVLMDHYQCPQLINKLHREQPP